MSRQVKCVLGHSVLISTESGSLIKTINGLEQKKLKPLLPANECPRCKEVVSKIKPAKKSHQQ